MILKIVVLVAAVAQVAAAGFLSIGTFETTERMLPVFIQPAGWTFSVWGVIYSLSLIYAVYQIIPRNDNQLLQQTRVPALVAFGGSIVWLYFAGADSWQVWLTIPTLFAMTVVLRSIVRRQTNNSWQTIISTKFLWPYAAWTAIASWLNIQALLVDQAVITSSQVNYVTNAVFFAAIATTVLFYFRRSGYSAWYGAVIVWASIGIIAANLSAGSVWFAVAAAGVLLVTGGLWVRRWWG